MAAISMNTNELSLTDDGTIAATASVDFTCCSTASTTISIAVPIMCPGVYDYWPAEDEDDRLAREFRERITAYRKGLFKAHATDSSLVNTKINKNFHNKQFHKRTWTGKESRSR